MTLPFIKFITPLLTIEDDGNCCGPKRPVAIADSITTRFKTKYDGLSRIVFSDEEMYQKFDDTKKRGVSEYDILVISVKLPATKAIFLILDLGDRFIDFALVFENDREITYCDNHQAYLRSFIKFLSDKQLNALVNYLFDNFERVFQVKNQLYNLCRN